MDDVRGVTVSSPGRSSGSMATRSSEIAGFVGRPVAIRACSPRRIPMVTSSSQPGSSST